MELEIRIYFQSSTCEYPIFPTPFFEEDVFDTFVKNQMAIVA
jgi:hypothetical protein